MAFKLKLLAFIITLLNSNQIEKQQVDEFKPGQRVPYCRLQVTFDKERKPVELNHRVKLLGTKRPHDFFTITCSPEGTQCRDIILCSIV